LDIAQAADVTITVLVPESGDDIQAMKAGIMEITDIFVVNKADRHGAEAMVLNLRSLTQLRKRYTSLPWEQPVIKTVATEETGIDIVLEALEKYKSMLQENDQWETIRLERMEKKVIQLVENYLSDDFWSKEKRNILRKELQGNDVKGNTPFRIAENLLSSLRNT
jgi:GTPase